MSNATPGTAGIAPSASGKSSANCAMVLLVAAAGSSLDQRVREGAGCYGPELRITGAAAQTRMVSVARIRLVSRKSTRLFKGIICDDISEFESHMPSHAVASLWARQASWIELRFKSPLGPWSERASSSRATFAMISANCVAGRDQGRGIACAFGMPVHWGCNDSVVADYRRIPSGSRGGERAGARLGVRL